MSSCLRSLPTPKKLNSSLRLILKSAPEAHRKVLAACAEEAEGAGDGGGAAAAGGAAVDIDAQQRVDG